MTISVKLLELQSLRFIMAVLFRGPLLLLLLIILHCLLQLRYLPLQITQLLLVLLLLRRNLNLKLSRLCLKILNFD